jgi:hypothetical protein
MSDQNQQRLSYRFGYSNYSSAYEFVVYIAMQVHLMNKEAQINDVCYVANMLKDISIMINSSEHVGTTLAEYNMCVLSTFSVRHFRWLSSATVIHLPF